MTILVIHTQTNTLSLMWMYNQLKHTLTYIHTRVHFSDIFSSTFHIYIYIYIHVDIRGYLATALLPSHIVAERRFLYYRLRL